MNGGGNANSNGNIGVNINSGAANSSISANAITKSSMMFRQFTVGAGRRQLSGKASVVQKI